MTSLMPSELKISERNLAPRSKTKITAIMNHMDTQLNNRVFRAVNFSFQKGTVYDVAPMRVRRSRSLSLHL